jgi:hypothetical protein
MNIKQMRSDLKDLEEGLNELPEEFRDEVRAEIKDLKEKIAAAEKAESEKDKLKVKAEKKIAAVEKAVSSPKTSPKVKAAVSKGIAAAKKQVKEAAKEDAKERRAKTPRVSVASVKRAAKSGAKRGRPKKAAPAPAKKVVKRKTKAVVKYEKALSSLDKLVNRTKELREKYKGQGVDLKRDSVRTAKRFGWRLKGSNRRPTKAQIQSGAAYWEGRPNRADVYPNAEIKLAKGGFVKNSKGNYRKQTKAEIKNDVKFKAKKAGWKKSEETGDWYYEDRPNRTDKSRTLRYASGGFVKNSKGNYRKQTKAELAHDSRFKAKKAGWKQSEETGDWYYEDRPNRTDKSRKLKV